jgi:hypothetical protein
MKPARIPVFLYVCWFTQLFTACEALRLGLAKGQIAGTAQEPEVSVGRTPVGKLYVGKVLFI